MAVGTHLVSREVVISATMNRCEIVLSNRTVDLAEAAAESKERHSLP
jgi:hypothetical protein